MQQEDEDARELYRDEPFRAPVDRGVPPVRDAHVQLMQQEAANTMNNQPLMGNAHINQAMMNNEGPALVQQSVQQQPARNGGLGAAAKVGIAVGCIAAAGAIAGIVIDASDA